jgi:hypothetical protein
MNEHPSPEFEKEIRESLNAPNANPAFVRDLRATLIERSMMKTQTRTFPRLAWGIALAILLIALLAASPRVVTALKKLLGYVPGIGYVEQGNSLRVLSAPVTVEKDGAKVTIERGVADAQHTVLLERVDGITPDPQGDRFCATPARLVLPDGTVLKTIRYETTREDGKGSQSDTYLGRFDFEAMPIGQMDATLETPCTLNDSSVTNLKFQLHFQIADASQVLPVIELPTAAPTEPVPSISETVQTGPAAAPATPAGSIVEGFSILLKNETPLADGYILAGSYQWTDARFDGTSLQPDGPIITDANGRNVDFAPVDDPAATFDPAEKKLPFAYQITGKDYTWPLTITVNSLIVSLPDEGTFQFDPGPNPQVGQVWNPNIDALVAGHIVHVQTIKLISGRTPTQLGYEFTLTSDSEVMCAGVGELNPIIIGKGGGGGGGGMDCGSASVPFTSGGTIEGYSPAGVKTFIINGLSVTFHGAWQTVWQSPTP